jgi:hypothetical protein
LKKKFLSKGFDSAIRMFGPKMVTITINIFKMGPRMIFRSAIYLLRANLVTRILSCLTLLILDGADLYRKRISKVQFIRNVTLSIILIAFGTIGWNIGSKWILIEVLGSAVEVIGGMIGAGLFGVLSSVAFDKVCGKFVKSDAEKMRDIIRTHISGLPAAEQGELLKEITNSELKKMYASPDKDAFAAELVKTHTASRSES